MLPDFSLPLATGQQPCIYTQRLILRRVRPTDVPALLPISFFEGRRAETLAEAQAMRRRIYAEEVATGRGLHWALALRATGQVLGSAGFYRGFADGRGEIGYVLLPAFQGHGYATEAAVAMTTFGFNRLGLREVFAQTDPDNAASVAVLHRAGFAEDAEAQRADARLFRWMPPHGVPQRH